MARLGDQWIYFLHKTFSIQFDFFSIISVCSPCSKFVFVCSEYENNVLILGSFGFVKYSVSFTPFKNTPYKICFAGMPCFTGVVGRFSEKILEKFNQICLLGALFGLCAGAKSFKTEPMRQ